jgi:hypothetical protein
VWQASPTLERIVTAGILCAQLQLAIFAAEYPPESFSWYTVTIMGSLKKRRKAKINKHKRRKKLRANRHKKRTWQK